MVDTPATAPLVADMGAIVNVGSVQLTTPGTIAAGGTFTSPVIPTFGMPHIALSAKIDQAGTLSLTSYIDNAGSVAAAAATTKALVANTQATIDNNSTLLAQAAKISIVNSATVAANVANIVMVLGAR